ncbi:hypothetical protein [Rhizobium sp.]|jgi:hypothetical protein|uniref:hypothetical protein n=1 Tax=Rhizobium sp. TaxID=391 RepID=UPI000E8BDBAB|nr:hypothetical protein [Rhizobium sp.]
MLSANVLLRLFFGNSRGLKACVMDRLRWKRIQDVPDDLMRDIGIETEQPKCRDDAVWSMERRLRAVLQAGPR